MKQASWAFAAALLAFFLGLVLSRPPAVARAYGCGQRQFWDVFTELLWTEMAGPRVANGSEHSAGPVPPAPLPSSVQKPPVFDDFLPPPRWGTDPGPDGALIVIDTVSRTLTLYRGGQPVKSWPVAVGKPESPTPLGYWRIVEKTAWGQGFGARWMGLDIPWGTYGIHGTNKPWSIGGYWSGGCVRMFNDDVIELYNQVTPGTHVLIRGRPSAHFGEVPRVIRLDSAGTDVIGVQVRLFNLGLYGGPIDGYYGPGTAVAVQSFQKMHGLRPTGEVDQATFKLFKLRLLGDDPNVHSPASEALPPP